VRLRPFFIRYPIIFLAVREDGQHISPAKPVASSRVSGAWKKVCIIIKIYEFDYIFIRENLEW